MRRQQPCTKPLLTLSGKSAHSAQLESLASHIRILILSPAEAQVWRFDSTRKGTPPTDDANTDKVRAASRAIRAWKWFWIEAICDRHTEPSLARREINHSITSAALANITDRWAPTSTSRSSKRRSRAMSCASCFAFAAGRYAIPKSEYPLRAA